MNIVKVKLSHAIAVSSFSALLAWTTSFYYGNEYVRPPVEEVLVTIDVVCGNLIETDVNWSSRLFYDVHTNYFCSQECFETYLKLVYDRPTEHN